MRYQLTLLIGLLAVLPARAADPVVDFQVQDGWVHFAVSRDDQPVPGIALRVIDQPGAPYVEGEADEQGQGAFPAPASADCVITFTFAGKDADPILLMFPDRKKTQVEPARVLITFDRRPCCNLSKLRPADGLATSLPWLTWVQVAVGLVCLGGGLWLYRRRDAG